MSFESFVINWIGLLSRQFLSKQINDGIIPVRDMDKSLQMTQIFDGSVLKVPIMCVFFFFEKIDLKVLGVHRISGSGPAGLVLPEVRPRSGPAGL
jgi:hypothetical protein